MAHQPINIKRAHIISGVGVYGRSAERNSLTTISVRVPLTVHAKRRLGIPAEHKAFVMLLIDKTVTKEG